MRVSLTPHSVAGIQAFLHAFQQGRRIELLYFQSMLGLLSAAVMAVPLGLLRARPLQCWLNAFNLHPRRHRHRKLTVIHSCLQALLPWRDISLFTQGVPLCRVPSRRMLRSTDASDRLGSGLRGSNGERALGTPVGQRTHQCPGAQGDTPWPVSTSSLYTGQACSSTDR